MDVESYAQKATDVEELFDSFVAPYTDITEEDRADLPQITRDLIDTTLPLYKRYIALFWTLLESTRSVSESLAEIPLDTMVSTEGSVSLEGTAEVLKITVRVGLYLVHWPTNEPGPAVLQRAICLIKMASLSKNIFQLNRNIAPLEMAAVFLQQSLERFPEPHPMRASTGMELCRAHVQLFTYSPDRKTHKTINDAVSAARDAIQSLDEGDVNLPVYLNELADVLEMRAEYYETPADISECMSISRRALEVAETLQFEPSIVADLRAAYTKHLYRQVLLGADLLDTINQCTAIMVGVGEMTPPDHPAYHGRKLTLARYRLDKSKLTGYNDIDDVIDNLEALIHEGLPHKSAAATTFALAQALLLRHTNVSHSIDDVDKSIKYGEETRHHASYLPKLDATITTTYAATLAITYWLRFSLTENDNDLRHCLQIYDELRRSPITPPRRQFNSAIMTAEIFHKNCGPPSTQAFEAYRQALDILPTILMSGRKYRPVPYDGMGVPLSRDIRADVGADAAACAIACGYPGLAVEFVEQGRCLGWSRGANRRASVELLFGPLPELSNRLEAVMRAAEAVEKVELLAEAVYPGRRTLAETVGGMRTDSLTLDSTWANEIARIREIDGYDGFMLPPKFDELRRVSSQGPVVIINISDNRSDALILSQATLDRPQIVPLSKGLKNLVDTWRQQLPAEISNLGDGDIQKRDFNTVLSGLWIEIVQPVREALRSLAPYARRIWWCPIGRLTFLPLHAATNGPESDIHPILIPSYTPNLSTLTKAQSSAGTGSNTLPKVLAVGHGPSDAFGSVPRTTVEIQTVEGLFRDIGVPCTVDLHPMVDSILPALETHSWVHIACPCVQLQDFPFMSNFVMTEGVLRMTDLIALNLPTAQFAFLSASHTAEGILALPDEVLHFAALLHFSGFQGIVATQRTVSDEVTPRLVHEFYAHLLRDGTEAPDVRNAAEALHVAIQALREQGVPPRSLAPFVHIGI